VVISFLALTILVAIMYQDFKQRKVSIALLGVLFVIFCVDAYLKQNDLLIILRNFSLNICFIIAQLAGIKLYFIIKSRKNTPVIDTYIGMGDVLFFFISCMAFSIGNFVMFYLISLIVALIGTITYMSIKNAKDIEIPLAGIMSSIMSLCIGYKLIGGSLNFYRDTVLFSFLK
jgi:hypothetical protein